MADILFPSEAIGEHTIDAAFGVEREAAEAVGHACYLIDHTRATTGDVARAIAHVPSDLACLVYRGWMVSPQQYAQIFDALALRSTFLLNTAEAYLCCHYLPESYHLIEGHTPRSTWAPLRGTVDRTFLRALAEPFGDGPIVIKDYVKSQKHYWDEACFIPNASDIEHVERVVNRFLELQGDDLNVGLVFRQFVPLKIIGRHPKSGMPLAAEFRIFWLDGEPLLVRRYWAELVDYDVAVPVETFRSLARRIPSRFFTMDVALVDDGTWIVVELGDAQVSGLPSDDVATPFYSRLRNLLS